LRTAAEAAYSRCETLKAGHTPISMIMASRPVAGRQ
jgi:hypothetical protein